MINLNAEASKHHSMKTKELEIMLTIKRKNNFNE
jgi:hypothetical protein